MSNNDNIMNNPKIKKMLSELKGKVHIPFELIVADAEGKLSPEGHSKIAAHIKACRQCEETFQLVKNSLDFEEDTKQEKPVTNISVSPALQPKLKLVAEINSKRDELIRKVAELLLPEESWFMIRAAITVYRDWLKTYAPTGAAVVEELQIAAFSGGSAEDEEEFGIVIETLKFVDYLCDLITERCNNINEIQKMLPGFVEDAWAIFKETTLNQELEHSIFTVVENHLIAQ